ncbi:polysaccharide lyase beta-sandwich domain-containing protein [Streptomyces sp. NBC_00873]|uniref:polysaccharide lyase family 8 super-sandwich domain-containing protein n=1 Tax=unclassified Streptomyces TaxID=2593676 RepID=UPI00386D0F14|nr:polysaccharide lyase beta-sandwich domain-containing protein [Streptomyces sp. NBC_00873]WTA41749.1 polysaccharide lyase beta-sandwich domain-containing protein [Streptomyces sp. NBC_00842]
MSTSTAGWAGGAALPGTTLGAYGMELRAFGSSLHGLKSWFCLDDVIACVGSGITADAGTAETVVENRKLRDPRAALLVNGTAVPADAGWSDRLDQVRRLHLAKTGGYIFPEPAQVSGVREDRTATWREINLKYGTDTPVTRPYLTLWQDHGTAPDGAGYFWLQAPAASAERTRRWSAAPPVKLVADSTAVHAVRRCADGLFAANFWTAGTAQDLTSDGPASVLVRPEGKTVTVSLSDPTQLRSGVVLDLDRRGLSVVSADPGVSAASTAQGIRITADTAELHGATLTLTLKRS